MLAHDLRRAAAAAFDRLHEAERATATARDAVRVRGQTAELHDRLQAVLEAAQSGRAVAVR
jgi:hypothetical protein